MSSREKYLLSLVDYVVEHSMKTKFLALLTVECVLELGSNLATHKFYISNSLPNSVCITITLMRKGY